MKNHRHDKPPLLDRRTWVLLLGAATVIILILVLRSTNG